MDKSTKITKGWPPERRAAYAARIRKSKIWLRSTGPRTVEGKSRSCQNALKHGCYSGEWKIVSVALRAQRQLLKQLKEIVKVLSIKPFTVDPIHIGDPPHMIIRFADWLAPNCIAGNTQVFFNPPPT